MTLLTCLHRDLDILLTEIIAGDYVLHGGLEMPDRDSTSLCESYLRQPLNSMSSRDFFLKTYKYENTCVDIYNNELLC